MPRQEKHMNDYSFSEQEQNDLKEIFFVEAYEIMQSLDQELLNLETGLYKKDTLRNIERYLHTLKGNSQAVGFTSLSTITHKAEDLVKAIEDSATRVDYPLIELLFAVHDGLQSGLDGYHSNVHVPLDEHLLERIESCLKKLEKGENVEPSNGGQPAENENLIHLRQGATHAHEKTGKSAGHSIARSLRVDARRVDKILNLVGELVIGRSIVGQVLSEIGDRYKKDELVKRLGDANAFMEKTLSHLQKTVMKIRMLPISHIFRKFPRVVRDVAVEKGKQVDLLMEGEKTEIDKSIIDEIGEPLIHLVRNAVDHGIELPEDREQAGKRRKGTVTLRASHDGNQIMIEVIDDGKGIDPSVLRKKVVQKGLKTQEEADRLCDEEALDLIFLSGFSTADVVTDISGRGFGMDIVRGTVESLKGRIQIRSKPGEGTTVSLRLPLTLAIIRAMLFRVGDRLFALPLSSIEKIMLIGETDLPSVAGKNILRYRDTIISLIFLDKAFMITENEATGTRKKFVIIVSVGNKLHGFVVDELVGQQELVIKSLENHWGTVNCTSGASILGNGKVVLILDAPSIIAMETRREFV